MTGVDIAFKLRYIYYAFAAFTGLRREDDRYTIGYLDRGCIFRTDDGFRVRKYVADALRNNGFFVNALSFSYQGMIGNFRKVDGDYQYHIRIYADGRITGHYEAGTIHPIEHMYGYGFRVLTSKEAEDILAVVTICNIGANSSGEIVFSGSE